MAGVQCYATDLDALEEVAEQYGCELVRGNGRDLLDFKWYGRWVGGGEERLRQYGGKAFHKIRVKNAGRDCYEIGLIPRPDGKEGWELIYDYWQGGYGLEAVVGKGLVKLKNGLLEHMTIQQLRSEGYEVNRELDPETGEILITAVN